MPACPGTRRREGCSLVADDLSAMMPSWRRGVAERHRCGDSRLHLSRSTSDSIRIPPNSRRRSWPAAVRILCKFLYLSDTLRHRRVAR
jgi:hypothetical protein